MSKLFIKIIEFYQKYLSFDKGILAFLAPGGACKYSPTCSEYAKIKIREFGVIRGGRMALKRIWECR